MIIEFWRDLGNVDTLTLGESSDVPESSLKARFLSEFDQRDPLNQPTIIGFRNGKFGAKIVFANPKGGAPTEDMIDRHLSALLQFIVDHADEIKAGIA